MPKSTFTFKGSSTIANDQAWIGDWQNYKDDVAWMIYKDRPDLAVVFESMRDDVLLDGGEEFGIPIVISGNPNGGPIGWEEGVSMDDFDPLDQLVYRPYLLAYGIRDGFRQKRTNRGKNQRINRRALKMEATIESIQDNIVEILWGSQSGDQAHGLADLIPATLPASQTTSIGGKAPSVVEGHYTQAINMSGEVAAAVLEDRMLTLLNTIALNKGNVDYIFTDQTTHETYEKNQRDFLYSTDFSIGDVNFKNGVKFKDAPLIFSANSIAGEMRFIDKREFMFSVDPEYYLEWTDMKGVPNVPFTEVAQNVSVYAFCRRQGRRLGCIFNIA